MDCPGFQVAAYGIYDSRAAYPKQSQSKPRLAACFELELYTEELGGISYINGQPHPLQAGLFLCGKPGHRRYSRLPVRCYYVHLTTKEPALKQLLESLPDACRLTDATAMQQCFLELAALPYPHSLAENLQVQSLITKLIFLAARQTHREMRTDSSVRRSHRAMMLDTENYIRGHLSQPLTLEQLSARVQFSPSHFHTIFTGWFGQTPHEFVLACRIEEAKAALRSDRCSLIELAADCGFSSQSHFTAQFKKVTGQTPLQYRKSKLSRLAP